MEIRPVGICEQGGILAPASDLGDVALTLNQVSSDHDRDGSPVDFPTLQKGSLLDLQGRSPLSASY